MNWRDAKKELPVQNLTVFAITYTNTPITAYYTDGCYWVNTDSDHAIPDPIVWAYVDIQEAINDAS